MPMGARVTGRTRITSKGRIFLSQTVPSDASQEHWAEFFYKHFFFFFLHFSERKHFVKKIKPSNDMHVLIIPMFVPQLQPFICGSHLVPVQTAGALK